MDVRFTLKYCIDNWKQGIHLLFRTKRFGVNNGWWSEFNSLFGWSIPRIIISIILVYPIIENYQQVKFRAAGCHIVSEDTARRLGWYRYWEKVKLRKRIKKIIFKIF